MKQTDSPDKLVLPFADAGAKNTIPTASQIGITAGAASLTDGFPPLTRTPISAGGVPPSGQDMNGVLYLLSAVVRWACSGGGFAYDSAFATDANVDGYPKGARVMRSDGRGYWINTVDDNTTDPESAGAVAAGWVPDFTNGSAAVTMTSANVTLTPLQYGKPVILITGALTADLSLIFPAIVGQWVVVNNTSGAHTITAKTASGTGVPCVQSGSTYVYGEGTNIAALSAQSLPNPSSSIQGAAKNLKASSTGVSSAINLTADEIVLEDSTNNYQTVRSVSLTIDSAASGANGLDTGTLAGATWYAMWVIWNGTTTAGLLSLSATAPTLPSGYTHKARMGWVRTDGTANKYPLSFYQAGKRTQYKVAAGSNLTELPKAATGAQGSTTTPTYVSTSLSSFVPSTATIGHFLISSGVAGGAMVAPNSSYGALLSTTNPPPLNTGNATVDQTLTQPGSIVLESSSIYVAIARAAGYVAVTGWEE